MQRLIAAVGLALILSSLSAAQDRKTFTVGTSGHAMLLTHTLTPSVRSWNYSETQRCRGNKMTVQIIMDEGRRWWVIVPTSPSLI
jgi:hypothetical protein